MNAIPEDALLRPAGPGRLGWTALAAVTAAGLWWLAGPAGMPAAPTASGQTGQIYVPSATWRVAADPSRIDESPDDGSLVLLANGGGQVVRLTGEGDSLGAMTTYGLSEIAAGAGASVFAIRDQSIVRLAPTGYDLWSKRINGEYHPQVENQERRPFLAAVGWDPAASRTTLIFDRDSTLSLSYSIDGHDSDGLALMFPEHVYWDLDYRSGRGYLLNRSNNTVEEYVAGAAVAAVPIPVRAERIAVGPGDRLFALVDRRYVYAIDLADPSGGVIDAWEATDPEPGTTPSVASDLAVDASGRVYVTDPARGQVRVYELGSGTRSGPTPGPSGPGCQILPRKWADPTFLWLGQKTQVTLRLDGTCQEVSEKADIVLVVDRSNSMQDPDPRKIVAARQSILTFVGLMDLRRDQVALVTFASEARIDVGLTRDRGAIEVAANALTAGGGTDIAEAIDLAQQVLRGPTRRPDAKAIVVFMTDGVPFDTSGLRAVAAMDRLRYADIPMAPALTDHRVLAYAIGLGEDVEPSLLQVLASAHELYYYAPDADDLEAAYRAIARRIYATVLLKQVTIVDHVPDNMAYQLNSAVPPAFWDASARTLTWELGDVPFEGLELSYWLEPQAIGTWPTNVRADYDGTDGLDHGQEGPFPVPRVVVVAPTFTPSATVPATVTPTGTATATPTSVTPELTPPPGSTTTAPPTATGSPTPVTPTLATATATDSATTATPRPTPDLYTIYVIIVFNGACFQRYTDVSLVIDASTTMLEPSEAGRIKLDEAKDAARAFVDRLSLVPDRHGRHDQAAIVWYNDVAEVAQPLTNDRRALLAAIDSIRPVEGSRIDLGLQLGHRELLPEHRPNRRTANTPAMVLLSDGLPNRVPTPVASEPRPQEETIVNAADAAKADGITVFTVGYGRRVQTELLQRVASQPSMYFYAADGAALERIYHSIAGELVCR